MIQLIIGDADLLKVKSDLLSDGAERCAVLYASQVERRDGTTRLLVRDFELPSDSDYLSRDALHASLSPTFVARVTKRARSENLSLIFSHSHVGPMRPSFSLADDEGEQHLQAFLAHRHPTRTHSALVMSEGGYQARVLGSDTGIQVVSIGNVRRVLVDSDDETSIISSVFDRQVRAFGAEGQRAIEKLTIGIVGLGGTGSLIAQQLSHLGVRRFILIDPDVLEQTNLNRVVNATVDNVGDPKVQVAKNAIEATSPHADVVAIQGDIIRARVASELFEADVLFGCTDSHGSRAVLQQIAYQYLIPCIDMGTTIIAKEQEVTGIFGRVQLLAPGFSCFTCSGLLDSEEVRRDMMSAFEKKMDPYIQGEREPAPAVISLNSTVASMAITMFMAVIAGLPSSARHITYNAKTCTVRPIQSTSEPNCYICSRAGAYARGDSGPLFTRQD